jgi:hypothetical protein
MKARIAAFMVLSLLAALLSSGVSAHRFGLGHLGLGMGKLGAAGSQGSNGTAPTGCGTGTIDASAGCPLPMLGS